MAFIVYAALGWQAGILWKVLPILVLHAALLPLNFIRLKEVTRTSKALRGLTDATARFDFLIPFMTLVRHPSGHTLFHKGAKVEDVYIIKSGTVSLNELGKQLGPGAMFGEVAVFSDHASRTVTAHCSSDCEFYRITGAKVLELFYQDRKFSFQIARLLAGYAR